MDSKWIEHKERLETMAEQGSIYGLSSQDREAIQAALTRLKALEDLMKGTAPHEILLQP